MIVFDANGDQEIKKHKIKETCSLISIVLLFSVLFSILGFILNFANKQNNIDAHFGSVETKIQKKIKKIKQLSHRQFENKLKNHQLIAYQKVFIPHKIAYYSVFYNKKGKKYKVNLINNPSMNNSQYFDHLKTYNVLSIPYNKPRQWYCVNKTAIKQFLGQKQFAKIKIRKQNIKHQTVCPDYVLSNAYSSSN